MALCKYCGKDMLKVNGCTVSEMELKDGSYKRIRYGDESSEFKLQKEGRCHDCGAKQGYYHHVRCDAEQCPRCKGQLLSCSCLEDNE